MTDLFETLTEISEERAGICEFDGLMTREEAEKQGMLESERYRHSCEIRDLLARPLEDRREMLKKIERTRGKEATDKIRADLTAEWARRKAA